MDLNITAAADEKTQKHIRRDRDKIWSLHDTGSPEDARTIAEIAEQLDLEPICCRVLYHRGYRSAEAMLAFLRQSEEKMHDPFLLSDIVPAVERIRRAVAGGEKIAIYGDYDVDGVTSVSMLYLYLKEQGADVCYYIPSRCKEGYGVSAGAIDYLADEEKISLMITVDTGITANDEVLYAQSRGIDTVITDHHECHAELPLAVAVVNPHRPDCPYPFKELAGVGVVFKLLCAMEITRCREAGQPAIEGVRRICEKYADLTAIGTIADVMPIVDENRLIVTLGLRMIANTHRKGLSALIDASLPTTKSVGGVSVPLSDAERASQRQKRINSGFIGFGIAPRINAAGRISNASRAVELMLAEDEEEAKALAMELCEINLQRQIEENRVAEQAYEMIEQNFDFENDRVIILDNDHWAQGIIGIVSSRITERYGLPSILISFDGAIKGPAPTPEDIGKGSGRSIKGMNLVEALAHCQGELVRFGGHELAAGLSIQRGSINYFTTLMNQYARERLSEDDLAVHLDADCELTVNDLTLSLAEQLNLLEPFGVANPVPQFVLRDVTLTRVIPMGNGKHTKLIVQKDGASIVAVYFGMSSARFPYRVNDRVDLLFRLNINEYQNERTLQLFVQDIHLSDAYLALQSGEKQRYDEICAGASFDEETEHILPSRDDCATLYTVLRREYRQGHAAYSERTLLNVVQEAAPGKFNYIKLKFILRIFQELNICGVMEPQQGYYIFDIYFTPNKTSIDKSSILRKLRSQCHKKT